MRTILKAIISLGVAASLLFAGLAPAAAEPVTVKNQYFTFTYPSVVTLPNANCGTFKVKYAMTPALLRKGVGSVEITVWSFEGERMYLDWFAQKTVWYKVTKSLNSPTKGTLTMNFCKTDWKLTSSKSIADAYSSCSAKCDGVMPGKYKIVAEIDFGKGDSAETYVDFKDSLVGDIEFVART